MGGLFGLGFFLGFWFLMCRSFWWFFAFCFLFKSTVQEKSASVMLLEGKRKTNSRNFNTVLLILSS